MYMWRDPPPHIYIKGGGVSMLHFNTGRFIIPYRYSEGHNETVQFLFKFLNILNIF